MATVTPIRTRVQIRYKDESVFNFTRVKHTSSDERVGMLIDGILTIHEKEPEKVFRTEEIEVTE